MLNRTKSHSELQEAHTKLEASHKELQKRIAELTLDADIAKRERDKLQAFIDRTRRADQTKK
jgi:Skp family chaperone for outer membrane proteins